MGRGRRGREECAEVDGLPREGGEARRWAAGEGDALSLSPEPAWRPQGPAGGRAGCLRQVEEMRRPIHQRPAQGQVVIRVLGQEGRHDETCVRNGLRNDGTASICWWAAGSSVRGRDQTEYGIPQEVRRVRQGPEA